MYKFFSILVCAPLFFGQVAAKGVLPTYKDARESRAKLYAPLTDAIKAYKDEKKLAAQARINEREGFARRSRSVFQGPISSENPLVSSIHATGADILHAQGYTGAGVTVAILEEFFQRQTINDLHRKGKLHPHGAHLHLPDQGRLENLTLKELHQKSLLMRAEILKAAPGSQKNELMRQHANLQKLMEWKGASVYQEKSDPGGFEHGSKVAHFAHQMAPGASIFPIEIRVVTRATAGILGACLDDEDEDYDDSDDDKDEDSAENSIAIQSTLDAVGQAIDAGAHIINCSFIIDFKNPKRLKPLTEVFRVARDKGIALVLGAGNDSEIDAPLAFSLNPKGDKKVKSLAALMLEELGYKGMLVAGSVVYSPNYSGPVASDFSQIPKNDKECGAFVCAPGQNILYNGQPTEGTSFAAPNVVGAFAVLREYAVRNHLPFDGAHDLLQLLRTTGTPVELHSWIGHEMAQQTLGTTINLVAACNALDQRVID